MYTIESLYRYYKKIGPISFELFIKEHPEFALKAELVKKMDSNAAVAY